MREKIYQALHGGDMEIRERLFRLILVVSMFVVFVAILAGLMLQNSLMNALPLIGMFAVAVIAAVATFKYHKVNFAVTLFSVTVIGVVFPIMFFASGGVDGGAAVWFVLGILFIFLVFQGKKLVFFVILTIGVDVCTYVAAYNHPQYIISLGSRSQVYYDSLFAVIMVGIAVGVVMRFQTRLFEKERELTLSQKDEIEKISRSKDIFFTNMSHEIRTPINTIIGLNEMILREEGISDEVAQDALNVKNASKMLLALINDILDFSQLESNRMTIVPVQYQPKQLFMEVVDLLRIRMKEKGLEFYVDIDSSLPSVLFGDEVRIKQVLVNLLTNAVKYTPKGCVTLSVRGELIEYDLEQLTMTVSDTGIGIKKEDLASLYHSFQRIDREKNRQIEGSGLGLAITKHLVSLMEGQITVDSIYTKGSSFTVILNQSIVDSTPAGKIDYQRFLQSSRRSYYKQSFEAPNARILIVDDNADNLLVAGKLLRATKVQIDQAKSGEECLEWTKQKIYHVILLDSMMPGMDGMETLKEIRRQENGLCRHAPVIALTANAAGGEEQRYLNAGFDGYLAKPVDGIRLEAEILKFLPQELLEYQLEEEERAEADLETQFILQRKRKKIQISTDSASDLSQEYVDRFGLKMMHLYVETGSGIFRDSEEIDADNLARHLADRNNRVRVIGVPVEEYEAFYAQALTEAEELIHISLASYAGFTFSNAVAAARGFDHVHVIDSGNVSCGQGLLVLVAANLLERGCSSAEELCRELEHVKELIEAGFFMSDVRGFHAGGYMGNKAAAFCRRFELYPAVQMRHSGMRLKGLYIGRLDRAAKRYVHTSLRRRRRIDKRIVFIVHSGVPLQAQQAVVEDVVGYVQFEKVIVQKSSASVAANGGLGAIGIAYLTLPKGENGDRTGYDWIPK